MNPDSAFDLTWWIWWSNPHHDIHPNFQDSLPEQIKKGSTPTYLQLLEIRSFFELPEVPENILSDMPALKGVCMASTQDRLEHLLGFAVLTMSSEILKYNAGQWKDQFGTDQPDTAREIIRHWSQIPLCLKGWSETLSLQLSVSDNSEMHLNRRIDLALAAYLKGKIPGLFKRWRLTLPSELSQLVRGIPPLSNEQTDSLEQWLSAAMDSVDQVVRARICPPSEETTELDSDLVDDADNAMSDLLNRINAVEDNPNA